MQVFLVGLAFVGIACGDVSHLGYKYAQPKPISPEIKLPSVASLPQYIPPTETKQKNPLPAPPATDYIPPVEVKTPVVTPVPGPAIEYIPPTELKVNNPPVNSAHIPQPIPEIPPVKKPIQDGYNYVTPGPIQPIAPTLEELAPQVDVEPAHEVANDGYRYKTVRKIKYRYRA